MRNENATLEPKMEYLDNTMSLIDCGKDIRLFELGGYLSAKYLSLLRLRNQSLKREKYCYFRMDVFNTVLSAVREGAIYGYLVFSFFNGRFDIGTFLLYFGALIGFSSVLVQVVDSASKIHLYAKCITDFKTVMELPDERKDSPQVLPLPEAVSIVLEVQDTTDRANEC